MRPIFRWLVWLAYSTAWTVALVVPLHVMSFGDAGGVDIKYVLAKTVHICAYALLAILTGWLRVPSRYRWMLMLLLAAHGACTEFVQEQFVEGRTGLLSDVLLDLTGILLGSLLSWKWWTDPA